MFQDIAFHFDIIFTLLNILKCLFGVVDKAAAGLCEVMKIVIE